MCRCEKVTSHGLRVTKSHKEVAAPTLPYAATVPLNFWSHMKKTAGRFRIDGRFMLTQASFTSSASLLGVEIFQHHLQISICNCFGYFFFCFLPLVLVMPGDMPSTLDASSSAVVQSISLEIDS